MLPDVHCIARSGCARRTRAYRGGTCRRADRRCAEGFAVGIVGAGLAIVFRSNDAGLRRFAPDGRPPAARFRAGIRVAQIRIDAGGRADRHANDAIVRGWGAAAQDCQQADEHEARWHRRRRRAGAVTFDDGHALTSLARRWRWESDGDVRPAYLGLIATAGKVSFGLPGICYRRLVGSAWRYVCVGCLSLRFC